jgi:hypothetical protein
MPGEYVSKEVCDERFDRILSNQERFEGKVDDLTGLIGKIDSQLSVFMAGREPMIKRIEAIEAQHKEEATEEVKHLKSDPDRRTVDRRWRILAVATLASVVVGIAVGVANLAEKMQASKTTTSQNTMQQTPNP